jgi:hypothetical protein
MAGKRKSSQLSLQPKQKQRKKAQGDAAPPKLNPKDLYEASDEAADEEKYAYKFDVSAAGLPLACDMADGPHWSLRPAGSLRPGHKALRAFAI